MHNYILLFGKQNQGEQRLERASPRPSLFGEVSRAERGREGNSQKQQCPRTLLRGWAASSGALSRFRSERPASCPPSTAVPQFSRPSRKIDAPSPFFAVLGCCSVFVCNCCSFPTVTWPSLSFLCSGDQNWCGLLSAMLQQ